MPPFVDGKFGSVGPLVVKMVGTTGTVEIETTKTAVLFTVTPPGYFDTPGSTIEFSTFEKRGVSRVVQFCARVRVDFAATFDSAILLGWLAPDYWFKIGAEQDLQGRARVVSVVTRGRVGYVQMSLPSNFHMLRGLGARDWYVLQVALLVTFFVYISVTAILFTAMWQALDARKDPTAVYTIFAGFLVLAFLIPVTLGFGRRKTKLEFASGYTTLPYISGIDLRDSRTGSLLRAADEPEVDQRFTLSLKRARHFARESGRDY